ncbi:hypothetical protein NDU88_003491 [Pleurodeles waltl]|uniref:Uncharacterized protein n=1 Tax=Pleurodeles waltl TaxID=8319 RepID=A0AAV7TPW7_PLEWA|nr:hypothetical protein NDU88_003491 [Pleurodeles waltl]
MPGGQKRGIKRAARLKGHTKIAGDREGEERRQDNEDRRRNDSPTEDNEDRCRNNPTCSPEHDRGNDDRGNCSGEGERSPTV